MIVSALVMTHPALLVRVRIMYVSLIQLVESTPTYATKTYAHPTETNSPATQNIFALTQTHAQATHAKTQDASQNQHAESTPTHATKTHAHQAVTCLVAVQYTFAQILTHAQATHAKQKDA